MGRGAGKMTNPTPEQLQRQMVTVLGWKRLEAEGYRWEVCQNEYCEDGEVLEGDKHRECGVCSGAGGKWVKS